MKSRRLTVIAIVLATIAAPAVVACGTDDGDGSRALGAAEPADAPPTSKTPAGRSADIGPEPQGIIYDSATDLIAVAVHDPYRLLLLDPGTLRQTRSVPLPGKSRHLQLARPGGPVLVPSETANQLVAVALPDGSVRSTEVEQHPHDAAAAANGDIAVGNEFSGSLSVVRDGTVIETVDDLQQPGSVIVTGDTAAVVDVGDYTLSTYDLGTRERIDRVGAGDGPTHTVLVGDNRAAVADTRGDAVLVFTLDPLKQVGRIDLAGSPYGLAGDPETGTVWVTLTANNELVGLDVSGGTPRIVARYPTVRQPDTVAVAPGGETLWVTGTADGVVQRITRERTAPSAQRGPPE